MELSATYQFNAPVESVWQLLMDTTAVAGCLPGCRGLQPIGGDRYQVELLVAIAAISGDFKGTVALEEKVPPDSYRMVVEGRGRPGFVKGNAQVRLEREDQRTNVRVASHAEVGGTIARVGQRLLETVARTTMDRFFRCLAKRLEQP